VTRKPALALALATAGALALPADAQARWIRVVADRDCTATAWLTYR
jgi:hypothetical protein